MADNPDPLPPVYVHQWFHPEASTAPVIIQNYWELSDLQSLNPQVCFYVHETKLLLLSKLTCCYPLLTQDLNSHQHTFGLADDKAIIGILIGVKHVNNNNSGSSRTFSSHSYQSRVGSTGNHTARSAHAPSPYTRMLFFADAYSPQGKCFVVIEKSHSDITQNWRLVDPNKAHLGSYILIKEPVSPCERFLSDDMPIVETKFSFILLQFPAPAFVQEIVYQIPEIGSQRAFLLQHNSTVMIHTATPIPSMCNGIFCDRQGKNVVANACGCYHTSRFVGIAFVVSYDLEFCHHPAARPERVSRAASWETTKLLFRTLPEGQATPFALLEQHARSIRQVARQICEFVNNNGGWTIIGWSRQGTQVDASSLNNTDSTVMSQSKGIHIVTLKPTTAQTADFQHLQFDAALAFQQGILANFDAA